MSKRNVSRPIAFWIGLVFVSSALLGCRSETVHEDHAEPQQTNAAPTASSVPQSTPTPEPVITYTEPERAPLNESIGIPAYYTQIDADSDGYALFAFTNQRGVIEYRTVGAYDKQSNGIAVDRIVAWFECDADGSLASAEPIDLEQETPGVCVPLSAEDLRLRKKYNAEDVPGLIRTDTNGEQSYYVYGCFADREPAFYPALSDGTMLEGALPVDTASIVVSPFAPTAEPEREGERHISVFIGSQSVAVFLAEDGDWTLEQVFICSTGSKASYTPRGLHSITAQYAYKAMSELNGEMVYAQYASRFSGRILFHTVPSAGEHKNYQPNGKQQVLVAEYEKLGTAASHGCVRMLAGDCYWIYRNCPIGTRVFITDDVGPEPPALPNLIEAEPYMDPSGTYCWDPTDPDPRNPYLAIDAYASAMIVPTLAPEDSKTPRPTRAATPKPTPGAE
ncbi:MAG: L,D-transpeptidase family protein [Clostridia bacterium]|nr:L,D-transpeptidase family protein [Clostridia bacterium]